MLVACAEVCFK